MILSYYCEKIKIKIKIRISLGLCKFSPTKVNFSLNLDLNFNFFFFFLSLYFRKWLTTFTSGRFQSYLLWYFIIACLKMKILPILSEHDQKTCMSNCRMIQPCFDCQLYTKIWHRIMFCVLTLIHLTMFYKLNLIRCKRYQLVAAWLV